MHPLLLPHGVMPAPIVGRALDVLNAPEATREDLQEFFRLPRSMLPGDLEELSPELWEELRVEDAAAEHE